MKVMAYNILGGGNLSHGDRTELLLEIIHEVNPDILGLCECTDFDKENRQRFTYFCDHLGMTGIMNNANSGQHVALLYKSSVRTSRPHSSSITMYNGFSQVRIESKKVGRINVIMTHLHPYSSWYRVTEAQTLLGRASSTQEAIIMGDMNMVAPSELPIDFYYASSTLITQLLGTHQKVDTQAIEVILNQNFRDLAKDIGYGTYPTEVIGAQGPAVNLVRLDYIFATSRLADLCKEIVVPNNSRMQQASDHLPIVADFDCD